MAARTRFGEIILVPLLDILQGIHVLSLMPAIVLFYSLVAMGIIIVLVDRLRCPYVAWLSVVHSV